MSLAEKQDALIPRCSHGKILLACPDDECEEQNAYLAEQDAAVKRYLEFQRQQAQEVIALLTGVTENVVNP